MERAGDDVEVTYEMIPINLYVSDVHDATTHTCTSRSTARPSPRGQVLPHLLVDVEDHVMLARPTGRVILCLHMRVM